MKRAPANTKNSRRQYAKRAGQTHRLNTYMNQRGGIRL